MKKAFYNYFDEIFDRSLYYGMNYNPHWNRNFEAASPQASDCTSQFITWFNLVNILWKKYEPSHEETSEFSRTTLKSDDFDLWEIGQKWSK